MSLLWTPSRCQLRCLSRRWRKGRGEEEREKEIEKHSFEAQLRISGKLGSSYIFFQAIFDVALVILGDQEVEQSGMGHKSLRGGSQTIPLVGAERGDPPARPAKPPWLPCS